MISKFAYLYNNSVLDFSSVPSDLISSVSFSSSSSIGMVGFSVFFYCTVMLSLDTPGAEIEFDYKLVDASVGSASGTTLTNLFAISRVSIFSAGSYTCTVTVTAPGVCGGSGSEPACPTKTSNTVSLTVRCE